MARKKRRRRKTLKAKFKKWWATCGTLMHVLFFVGCFLLLFTVTMIVIFVRCGSVPDTLVVSVFGACGFEGGICGWIKTAKERKQEREWQKEDMKLSGMQPAAEDDNDPEGGNQK